MQHGNTIHDQTSIKEKIFTNVVMLPIFLLYIYVAKENTFISEVGVILLMLPHLTYQVRTQFLQGWRVHKIQPDFTNNGKTFLEEEE